jgi:hypothetical protein
MNAAARSPDAARLKAVRTAYAAIAPARWTRAHDENGALIEAEAGNGERFVLARFDAASVAEVIFMADAPDYVGFLLTLLDQAFAAIRELKAGQAFDEASNAPVRDPKDFAAECAIKCAERRFQQFLAERHGLEPPLNNERAAQKVRSILGVTSRAELNEDARAAHAWKALRASFGAWLKAER